MSALIPRLTSNRFDELLSAVSTTDVEQVLHDLDSQIEWVPLGNNPDNFGPISIGADPFDGIAERITNAIDAIVEAEVELRPELKSCATPRDAIEAIFGFEEGNLKSVADEKIRDLASKINVRFLESGSPKRPTVEIVDEGIGQHPEDFPNTLLSLNRGYKVSKFYLIGAFGQGGQTSFAHSSYAIVVSRRHPRLLRGGQADLVGWTIVRYHDPSTATEFFKQGRWEYCVSKGARQIFTVPPSAVRRAFPNGTLIRLVSYNLPRGSSDVLQSVSTAWSYLSQALFDSVLPIRLHEARGRFEQRSQPLTGLARRLWRGGRGDRVLVSKSDSYTLDLDLYGTAKVNYWALSPANELDRWSDIKRGYVSSGQCVFVTLNGQRQGVESPTFLRDRVGLTYSHDYLIVQIDCDRLSKAAKKSLFSSTRDRLIDSDFRDTLFEEVVQFLRQDRNILAFERERRTRILSARSERDTTRVRQLVGKYIAENPDLQELLSGRPKSVQDGFKQPKGPTQLVADEIREEELQEVALLKVPTYLRITNAKDPVPVEKGGNALIRIETDAIDSYLDSGEESRLRIVHVKNVVTKRSISRLRDGRISYYVHFPSTTRVGHQDTVRVELDRVGTSTLVAERAVECVHPFNRKQEPARNKFPEPKIYPISREKNPETWAQFSWSEDSVGRLLLGKTDEPGIYVSLDNRNLVKALKSRAHDPEMVKSIEERYISGIAYYLLLRKVHEIKGKGVSPAPDSESDDSPELVRVAQTVATLSLPQEST